MVARVTILALLMIGCSHPHAPTQQPRPGNYTAIVDGVTIAYHVAGEGPVCLAHPGGPGAEWTYLRMPLVEKTFTMIYIEPVGTGASGKLAKPTDYQVPKYVEMLEGLRAHLGLDRVYVLGHSHGGFVAQLYALTHPDRMRGLILYDTSPTTGPDWQADVVANLKWFEKEPWFADASKALAEEGTAATDADLTAIFHREAPLYFAHYTRRRGELDPMIAKIKIAAAPTKASEPGPSGVAPPFDVTSKLGQIQCPTLIVVGEKDFICSQKMAERLHQGIHGSQLVVLGQSGHMGHVEEPEQFASAIARFAL